MMGNKTSNTISFDELSDDESDFTYFQTIMDEYQSDAVFLNIIGSPTQRQLNCENIQYIQNNLEEYEMVSLMYLVCNEADNALEYLRQFFLNPKFDILNRWIKLDINWKEKLIEALCIIQNYQILKQLGFKKADLKVNYLPNNPKTSVGINKTRKGLYILAEHLSDSETESFLKYLVLNRDFKVPNMESNCNKYLELYFLNWELHKLDVFKYVKSALKAMDKIELSDMLLDDQPETNATKIITTRDTTYPTAKAIELSESQSLVLPSCSTGIEEDRYPIDPENPGLLLIINQEEFYTEPDPKFKSLLAEHCRDQQLNSRSGTNKDKEKLEEVFNTFGYNIITKDNLPHYKVLQVISKTAKQIDKESSFIVCILSHGEKGVVYGANSCKIDVDLITQAMTKGNNKLKGLPKILILQSCQGNECQKRDDDDNDNDNFIPDQYRKDGPSTPSKTADLFIYFATIPGYAAIRNIREGSWLIQCLCSEINNLADRCHFSDICTRVNNIISTKEWKEKTGVNIMTPLIETTFTKSFYLLPVKK